MRRWPARAELGCRAVHRPRLVEQIGIAGNRIVAGLAAKGVGMDGKIAAAGIEQNAAFDAAIDRTDRGAGLGGDAAADCASASGAFTGSP